jgi:hypothetical protein
VLKPELGLVRIPMLSAEGQILDRYDPAVTAKTVGSTTWDVVVPQHQGLSRWRDHELRWKSVVLEYSGPKGRLPCGSPAIGMAVPVGRDRLFISPGNIQFWDREVFPSIAADDFWLVGVNEVSAALDPRPQPEPPYLGVRRVAVPLELGARILFHTFNGSTLVAVLDDKDAAGECSLCKFHIAGAQEEDLHEFALLPDGEGPKRVPFEREYLDQLFDTYSKLPKQPFQAKYLLGDCGNKDRTFAVYDHDGVELGRFNARDNFNGTCNLLLCDSELILLPGEDCSEDAFHGDMRLYDWRKGELVKNVSLEYSLENPGPNWLDPNELQDGLLEDTQTFYSVRRDWSDATVILHLCTPVQNEGS